MPIPVLIPPWLKPERERAVEEPEDDPSFGLVGVGSEPSPEKFVCVGVV